VAQEDAEFAGFGHNGFPKEGWYDYTQKTFRRF